MAGIDRSTWRPYFRLAALLFSAGAIAVACVGNEDRGKEQKQVETTSEGPTLEDAIGRYRAGDVNGAIENLGAVTDREPDNARAWAIRGQLLQMQEDFDGALASYERAYEINPDQKGAAYGAAAIYAQKGETDRALDLLYELKKGGQQDLSQITINPSFSTLTEHERFSGLLMTAEDFENPFVEDARVIHEWVGESQGDEFGWIARNVGDIDGDSIADIATSAPSKVFSEEQAGRIYVYSGRTGELLWSHSGEEGDRLGDGIETAGDVDGDGRLDVIASAPGGDRVFVYSGRDGEVILEIEASQPEETFGRDVLGIGDANGDGHADLVIGSPQNDQV